MNLHSAVVSGSGNNHTTFKPHGFKKQTDFISILTNFSPRSKLREKMPNMPQEDRVEARMAIVDLAASGADNLLDPDQLEELVTEELTYREKQLLQLRDEIIDFEDMDDNVSLSEFTLDDFRVELMNFLANNRKLLEEAPMGLYALTPTLAETKQAELFNKGLHKIVKPGVIFCLKHKNAPKDREKKSSTVNPLGKHYLLYIRDDGTVRFTFTQAKSTLSMFQKLCSGKDNPYQTLCDLFDKETDGGSNIKNQSELLTKAIKSIAHTFQKRTAAGLQSGRDFIIPNKKEQASEAADFELITWLVIK